MTASTSELSEPHNPLSITYHQSSINAPKQDQVMTLTNRSYGNPSLDSLMDKHARNLELMGFDQSQDQQKAYSLQMKRQSDQTLENIATAIKKPMHETMLDRGHGVSNSPNMPTFPAIKEAGTLQGMDADELRAYISKLHLAIDRKASTTKKAAEPRYQILHRIQNQNTKGGYSDRPYFDAPTWVGSDHRDCQIHCRIPVDNLELYLERNQNISFIVYHDYDSTQYVPLKKASSSAMPINMSQPPARTSETIYVVHRDLRQAVNVILESRPQFSDWKTTFQSHKELNGPYLFVFFSRDVWQQLRKGLIATAQRQLDLLHGYIIEQFGGQYEDVDHRNRRNTILPTHVGYLCLPGDVWVSVEDGHYVGHIASGCPKYNGVKLALLSRDGKLATAGDHAELGANQMMQSALKSVPRTGGFDWSSDGEKVKIHEWEIRAWNWKFDGRFQRNYHSLKILLPATKADARKVDARRPRLTVDVRRITLDEDLVERSIDQLSVFPIDKAPPDVAALLHRRGQILWECRHRKMVSYKEPHFDQTGSASEERYVVDLETYQSRYETHLKAKGQFAPGYSNTVNRFYDDLGPEVMSKDTPPLHMRSFFVQPTVKGYNLRRKVWCDLAIDNILDVKWNREAFNNLVIDHKSKDLLRALITHKLSSERTSDLIEGKGRGLIMLLHGGPGTGKTLTAESVAEIAEKPLYRVTCGDIGTGAEEVQSYLESVLHLGKTWGCVVLLDEADVFLEQRSLNDLQRNALVSVFLRVLEYYEGILILTSNRVGTFDEAFKSRIQLALHYPNLGAYQRRKVWELFIERLETFDQGSDPDSMLGPTVDVADLRAHLDELQAEPMNGRQIRNAINTARQYAEYKNMTMVYQHLRDVIEVSSKFDRYLDDLNGGFTQDELAEEDKRRLADGVL